jgi:hypothetical protein
LDELLAKVRFYTVKAASLYFNFSICASTLQFVYAIEPSGAIVSQCDPLK